MRSLIRIPATTSIALLVAVISFGQSSFVAAQTCPDTVHIVDTISVTRHAGQAGTATFTITNATACLHTVFLDYNEARMDISCSPVSPVSIPAFASADASVTITWGPYSGPCYPGVGTYYHDALVVVNYIEFKHITVKEIVIAPDPLCNVTISAYYHGSPLAPGTTLQADETLYLTLEWACQCDFCQGECSMPNLWEYSADNGATWNTFKDQQHWSYFTWLLPDIASTKFYIRTSGYDFFGLPFSAVQGPYTVVGDPLTCCAGVTGNVDALGIVDLSDLSLLVLYLTSQTRDVALPCEPEANVNAAGIIDLSDVSRLVAYLTVPGTALPACP